MRTVFFTAAGGDYKMFALPYIYSVLHFNDDAAVEVMLDGVGSFKEANREALDIIGRSDRINIVEIKDPAPREAAKLRFTEEPELQSEYVYIGDVDILIQEGRITDWHIANAERLSLPYSNLLRPCGTRLTGLHFTKRNAYYPVPKLDVYHNNDEVVLRCVVEARGHAMPGKTVRPVHGIHMSLNRAQIVRHSTIPHWGIGPREWKRYQGFKMTSDWGRLLPLMTDRYQALIERMETACREAFD